jgi:hypothetical protein
MVVDREMATLLSFYIKHRRGSITPVNGLPNVEVVAGMQLPPPVRFVRKSPPRKDTVLPAPAQARCVSNDQREILNLAPRLKLISERGSALEYDELFLYVSLNLDERVTEAICQES